MTYPISFRRMVVAHIKEGMGKREAARLFKISPNTLYQWLNATELQPRPAMTRQRKVDKVALAKHIEDYPDLYLRERASHFGVSVNAIWELMHRLGYRKKKSDDI